MREIRQIGDAALAVEAGLTAHERETILDQFRNTNLNGAAVADILDILGNADALLEFTEPFYEGGRDDIVRFILSWPSAEYDDEGWRSMVISMAVHARALLIRRVPSSSTVADLVSRTMEAAPGDPAE